MADDLRRALRTIAGARRAPKLVESGRELQCVRMLSECTDCRQTDEIGSRETAIRAAVGASSGWLVCGVLM